MYETAAVLTHICGLNRNADSVHHSLRSPSSVGLFLIETQLQFPNYFIPSSLGLVPVPKSIDLRSPPEFLIMTYPTETYNLCN